MPKFVCACLLLTIGAAGCAETARPETAPRRAATGRSPADSRKPERPQAVQRPPAPPDASAASNPEPVLADAANPAASGAPTSAVSGRVYRRSDDRPQHDDAALAVRGIRVYESKRLKLYTDIAPDIARTLPPVIDAVYDEWVRYFGPLPPDREGTEFQITGYLMAEADVFKEMGLVPVELPKIVNGRHWNSRFWMHDQPFDYYRRHLVIHEATHCFMTATREMRDLSPQWYIEGMAELFGTHRVDADGTLHFGVMPHTPEEVADASRTLGRIEMIQAAVEEGRTNSLAKTFAIRPGDFSNNEAYAWSWALCKLLDAHPRYRERFRRLGETLTPRAFEAAFREMFAADLDDLAVEWTLFVRSLEHGYDVERAAIEFRPGMPLEAGGAPRRVSIAADRGWQSSGIRVVAGQTYSVRATGRITLADEPKPWISEPQGISFRYADGRPLGQLLGAVRGDTDGRAEGVTSMVQTTPLGPQARLTPESSGTLYLRINDAWSELADNRGEYEVEVQPVAGSPPDR